MKKSIFITISFLIFILVLSFNVDALIASDVQFFSNGEPSGYFGSQNFGLMITFPSSVSANDVQVSFLTLDMNEFIVPDYCESNICYIESIFIPTAGEYEVRVRHQSDAATHLLTIDTGSPVIENLRLFFRGTQWYISAELQDFLSSANVDRGSGIAKIEILQFGNVIEEISVNTEQSYRFERISPFTVPESGMVDFTLRAYDIAGNRATSRFFKELDPHAPKIISINDNSPIWYGNVEGRIIVSIIIEDNDKINPTASTIVIGDITSNLNGCYQSDNLHYCNTVLNVPLSYMDSSRNTLITIRDTFGNEDSKTLNPTLKIDDSQPTLTRIWSQSRSYSEPARAFLMYNEFFAEFENALSGMNAENTIARILIPSQIDISASRCEMISGISRCYFTVPELGGDSIRVTILRASDNAGNSMISSSDELILYKDRISPAVQIGMGTNYNSLSEDNVVIIPAGQSAYSRVIATMDTGASISKIYVKQYSLNDNQITFELVITDLSSCSRTPSLMYCNIPPIPINQDSRIELEVYDGSEVPVSISKTLLIGESYAGNTLWRITEQRVSPQFYFDGIPSQFTITLNLDSQDYIYDTKIGTAQIESCISTAGSVENTVATAYDSSMRIAGSLSTPQGTGSTIEVNCTINLFSKRDRLISSEPESISVEFKLYSYDSGVDTNNPTSRADGSSPLEFLSSPTAISILSTAETVIQTGEAICDVYGMLTLSSAGLDATAAVVPPVEPAAKILDRSLSGIQEFAEPACNYVKCETPGAKKVLAFYNTIEGKMIGNISELGILTLTNSQNRRVQDSFVQSVLSACIPGIVQNVRKVQQVECGYAVCLLDVENGNYPAGMCDYAKSTAMCEVYGSELFVLAPYGMIVKDINLNIKSLLTSPITMAGGFAIDLASQHIPAIRSIKKFAKYAQSLLPIIGIEISTIPNAPQVDYCSMLEQRRST